MAEIPSSQAVSGPVRAPDAAGRRRFPWVRLLLHPAHSLPAAASPVLAGAALACHDRVFALVPVILAFIASWFIHVGGLFLENYWLLTRHAALREHPELAAAVDDGSLSLDALRRVTLLWFVLGGLSGAWLLPYAGVMAPVLGAIGAAASAGYCAGRFSVTRLGIGEPVFFAMFGIVAVVGTYYAQAATFHVNPIGWRIATAALPLRAFVIGLPLGAIITGVMLTDDLSNIDVDRAKRWRTRPVVRGVRWARREYAALMLVAYALPFWFWRGLGFDAWILLPLVSCPLAGWAIRLVYRTEPAKVQPVSPKTAAIAFLYASLLATGLVLSR